MKERAKSMCQTATATCHSNQDVCEHEVCEIYLFTMCSGVGPESFSPGG